MVSPSEPRGYIGFLLVGKLTAIDTVKTIPGQEITNLNSGISVEKKYAVYLLQAFDF
jgi:hypothetical protein